MKRTYLLMISIVVLVLDIYTKSLVLTNFALHEARTIITNFFHLVYVRNTGAAFGLGADTGSTLVPLLLNVGAIGVFALVIVYSLRTTTRERLLQIGLHLIMGGAAGNLIDRFRFGYVVDFLDFFVVLGGREHHWPAFNVADSAICVGIALLFIDMWKKPETVPSPVKS